MSQKRSGLCAEEKEILTPLGSEVKILSCLACNIINIPTELLLRRYTVRIPINLHFVLSEDCRGFNQFRHIEQKYYETMKDRLFLSFNNGIHCNISLSFDATGV